MAVFLINDVMIRTAEDGTSEAKTVSKFIVGSDTLAEAYEALQNYFAGTDEAEAGWELMNNATATELTKELVEEWAIFLRTDQEVHDDDDSPGAPALGNRLLN